MNAPEPGKREQRRALQQQLSRDQILDSAEEVFAAKGFHDATIKEIAHLAEFSVGAVYGFFENKEDLFVQIYLRRGDGFMERMRDLVARDLPADQRLRELALFEVEFMREYPYFGRLYLRSAAAALGEVESAIDRAVSTRFAEAMALQAAIFADGQREGTLRAGSPEVLARLFSGLVSSFQACDPEVMGDAVEAMGPAEAHDLLDIVAAAFSVSTAAPDGTR